MYRESAQKGIKRFKIFSLLALFMVFSFLYFPTDALLLQDTEESSSELSVINLRASFPGSFEMEAIHAEMQRIQDRIDQQELWEIEHARQLTPEGQINSYIDEIVTEKYPELDQRIIRAIVYNESHYVADAINSSSGTMGLMQVSPKWHTKRALNLGVTDLLDPYGNILVGCDILAEIARDTGSINYALDVFAGGYAYADFYVGSVSPARARILETVSKMDSGIICL